MIAALILCCLWVTAADAMQWTVAPGPSRAIGVGLTASRDASFPSWQYLPRETRSGGADFAIGALKFHSNTLRFGMSGMVEIESDVDTLPAQPHKGHSVQFWRGLFGFSTAFAFDGFAQRTLGPGSELELAVSIHHESSHDVDQPYWFFYAPIVGDFVQADLAVRQPWHRMLFDVRVQNKFFVGTKTRRNYANGPGAEVIARWKVIRAVQPFTSHYFEYLVGSRRPTSAGLVLKVPDNQYYRNLIGVVFPGRFADFALYASYMSGNQRGQQAFKEQNSWGWGMRVVLFGSE